MRASPGLTPLPISGAELTAKGRGPGPITGRRLRLTLFGWQVRGLYARLVAPDVNAQLPQADAAGRGAESGQQLWTPQAQLLRDDWRIRLHEQREALDPHGPARAVRGRRKLGNEPIERGQRARPPKLLLQPESPCDLGDEIAEALHGPPPAGHPEAARSRPGPG